LDVEKIKIVLSSSNVFYMALAVLMIGLNYTISGFRWRSLIFYSKAFSGKGVFSLIKLYFIGAFFNNFMPTSIGGDVYKAYVLGRNTSDMPKAVAATFVNRLSGLVILALFSSASLVLILGIFGLGVFVVFWIIIVLGFFALFVFSKYIPKLRPYSEALYLYKRHRVSVLESLFFSVLVQLVANLGQYFATRAVGVSITLPQAFFAFPIIGFLSFLPVSFNGFGIQDFLYKSFFGYWGISAVMSLSSSIIYHLCRVAVSLVGGVFLLLPNDKNRKAT
jgi:uncharacterized membrane protein YbhN (UPF0104 family)